MVVEINRSASIRIAALLSIIPIILLFTPYEIKLLILKAGELGAIEIMTALAFLGSMLISLAAIPRSSGWIRMNFILWFILSLLFFGEETSWLQHYLKYETPEIINEHNAQGEFNIHNLSWLQSNTKLIDFFRGDGKISLGAQQLFAAGFFFYFLILPFSYWHPYIKGILLKYSVLTPGKILATTICLPIIITYVAEIPGGRQWSMVELRELYFGFSIALFIFLAQKQTASSTSPSSHQSEPPNHA